MGWLLAALLALGAFALIMILGRKSRAGWEAVAAALLLGVAGYALQGRPTLAGAPSPPLEPAMDDPGELAAARRMMTTGAVLSDNRWMMIGGALSRHGQYGDAAEVLLGAVDNDPHDPQAWVALGNALVGHAEGTLSPAALYAYRHAVLADPAAPGPRFFLGLALAQSGRIEEARRLWGPLLAAIPPDAPAHADLADKLRQLDALIAARRQPDLAPRSAPAPVSAPRAP